jgi:hypothetical protein
LTDFKSLQLVKESYDVLLADATMPLPENLPAKRGNELPVRKLDCAVIETLHAVRTESKMHAFDSLRGVFWEGGELTPRLDLERKIIYSFVYVTQTA